MDLSVIDKEIADALRRKVPIRAIAKSLKVGNSRIYRIKSQTRRHTNKNQSPQSLESTSLENNNQLSSSTSVILAQPLAQSPPSHKKAYEIHPPNRHPLNQNFSPVEPSENTKTIRTNLRTLRRDVNRKIIEDREATDDDDREATQEEIDAILGRIRQNNIKRAKAKYYDLRNKLIVAKIEYYEELTKAKKIEIQLQVAKLMI